MVRLEEICERFFKSEKALEGDLMLVMRQKVAGVEPPVYIKGDYLHNLIKLLIDIECLEDTGWGTKVTEKGKEYYKRGWILHDYITQERRTIWKITREWIALAVAIIGTITGVIFPIQKVPQSHPILFEFKGMIPDTTIDLSDIINEVDQACDSACKKNCNKNK